jgi:hypothetical protein
VYSQEDYNVHFQKIREKHVKIELMDIQENVLNELQGICISGGVTIVNDNLNRRSCDLKFVLNNSMLPSENGLIGLNRKFRLSVGIYDIINSIVRWFELGIFMLQDSNIDSSVNEKTISIKGLDKMALFDIPLKYKTIISANTPLHEAVKACATLVNESTPFISNSEYILPYNIEVGLGENLKDNLLKEIVDLYMKQQCYYNQKGYLVFETYKDRKNDTVIWEFNDDTDFTVSSSVDIVQSNIKNRIKVVGNTLDDGSQPEYTTENNDTNSPFCINKIGEKLDIITEDKYYTVEQCKQKGEYEIERHSNLAEKIDITCEDIYLIDDVNKLIKFNSDSLRERQLDGVYLVDSISLNLEVSGLMRLTAHKLYV